MNFFNKKLVFPLFVIGGVSVKYITSSSSFNLNNNINKNNNRFNKILNDELLTLNDVIYNKSKINKKYQHLSLSYNVLFEEIFSIEGVRYSKYENYDFNKLSDLFLNIHIFIN